MANFTADTEQKPFAGHYCSTELAGGRKTQLIVLLAVNVFVFVTASLGNALILTALHKESSLHPPSKLLFRNLAATDLAVGIIVQPFVVTFLISVFNEQWHICRFAVLGSSITFNILCGVSLLTLTTISVDRLLALSLGIRYRQVVTLKRIYIICIVVWFVCVINATHFSWNERIDLLNRCSTILLSLATSVFSYTVIFFTPRHRDQVQIQEQQTQNVLLNRARYKKTVNSALWVQLTLVLCYLPNFITLVFILRGEVSPSVLVASLFTVTLLYLNSSLNPLLYCWKIREVRRTVKDIVKGLFC